MNVAALQSRTIPRHHPLHAILLAFPIAFFAGALLADIAYLNSAEIQWTNFAAWLITGALVFGAVVILWSAISSLKSRSAITGKPLYFILLIIMWISGLVNAFQHSRDGWSSVGQLGLILSIIATLCALAAGWIAYGAQDVDQTIGRGV
jgi:uncharacterized membrane protein